MDEGYTCYHCSYNYKKHLANTCFFTATKEKDQNILNLETARYLLYAYRCKN